MIFLTTCISFFLEEVEPQVLQVVIYIYTHKHSHTYGSYTSLGRKFNILPLRFRKIPEGMLGESPSIFETSNELRTALRNSRLPTFLHCSTPMCVFSTLMRLLLGREEWEEDRGVVSKFRSFIER